MDNSLLSENKIKPKLWKKALCVLLSVIIAFGTFVALTVGSSRLQDWLGIQSMLSAYASEIVDTKGAVAVDKESMLEDSSIIDLKNKDGSNTVYLFSEPISYTDENGNLKTKDISVEKQTDKEMKAKGYEYTNGQNDYRINFSKDSSKGLYIEFGNSSYSIIPQSDKIVIGNESISEILTEQFEDFEYKNIYGQGTNLKFYPQLNGIKDEIVLDSNIGQSVFSFKLTTSNCTAVLNDDGTVSLISDDNDESVQTFSAPFAYDSAYIEGDRNEHYIDCSYTLDKTDDNTYIMSVNVDKSWLESEDTVYPVTIDPTTGNLSYSEDVGVYSAKSSNNYGSEQTCCFGRASEYGYGRVLNYFKMPTAIKKGAVINSAYSWQRETTGRTTTTKVTPYVIIGGWTEGSVTYANKPNFTKAVSMASRTINSKSTDDSRNNYWYKFNIAPAIKAWADGTQHNYGLMFISSEEADKNYNWRAFASREYSSSAMRPYYVINYTNDTTAPTITSVTGNATAWTKNNVTLTVNGAKDNSGGSGLHATPYSFSTTKGSYSWQKDNKKTFSSNCTVYIYVRDALGNIRLASTQTINKIDKTAPTANGVSGNSTKWTNKDVILTVNGAKDTQSGLHSSAYSFSTTQGTYSWQTSNSKAFSANGTIYIYVRDAVGTPKLISTVEIDKIDKTAPAKPTVTGNTENWTNGNIELTAQSSDDDSGIAEYSFSTEVGKYNWQTENTYTESQNSKLYVYSKDNAGNISEATEVDLKIDKLSPTGTVNTEMPTDWVRQVVITADASDELSGLNEKPYSFSTKEGEYSWQSENTKTVTSNGTYYVYARDSAENIILLDTITVDKIDRTAPSIKNVDLSDNDNKTTITITAEDNQSGIAQYSIDNGVTWQNSNVFEIEKDSLNYLSVKVKDNLDNKTVLAKYYDIYTPQIYYENGKVGIYNPNPNSDCDIYYKLNKGINSKWIKYDKPFTVEKNQKSIYLSFYSRNILNYPQITPVEIEYDNIFAYSEKNTDLSLAYNGVSFNIDRQYKDGFWNYSSNSNLNVENNNLIKVTLPDFNSVVFIKQNKYLYLNESNDYKLVVVYDENDENIVEYILKYNNINYHYDSNGRFIKISNSSCDLFAFSYSDNSIIIEDGAGRKTTINYTDNNISSIVDANNGVVNYFYDKDNLVKVTDQADVIIGEYEYNRDVLTKSGHNHIETDSENRISRIVADNGYVTQYEYSDNKVIISTSDEKIVSFTYDFRGNILTSTDEYGAVTTYTYDICNRLIQTVKDDKILSEIEYDNFGRVISKSNETGAIYYYYNDNGDLIKTDDENYTSKDENIATHYVYDENGNIKIQAQFDNETVTSWPDEYNPDFNYKSVIRYEYCDGLPIKLTDSSGNTTVNTYDKYGNVIKTTNTVTQEDKTSVSITESAYDILNRLVLSKSDNSEIAYTYDAAGRTLLTNADGNYQRTVYDNYGRVIQEISNTDYNPSNDNLPSGYSDKTVGHRYTYDDVGNLTKEVNDSDIVTNYVYSDVGTLYKKSFDIYDYYYQNDGSCDKIEVNGQTIVDYDYKVADSDIKTEDGQYINRMTYADGYIEEYKVDETGNIYSKYANGKAYYSIYSTSQNKLSYYEGEITQRAILTSNDNSYNYLRQTNLFKDIFSYDVQSTEELQTITEKHFNGKEYQTVTNDNSISYISPSSSFEYAMDGDESNAFQIIRNAENNILTSSVSYDDANNILNKSYDSIGFDFKVVYDSNGNIISDGNNEYTYDELGELLSSSGVLNASYTYDSRGNMLSKTIDGIETTFTYNNSWQDQLSSVNNVALTYDANGNLSSYGNINYTWSHGKWLNTVTDAENSYSYKYDSNGIRSSKTVNGVTTNFDTLNGRILAQYDNSNSLYFQYYNDAPIGFILNDIQYFYVTNLNGDIVAITDANGNLIAKYSYDEWGKLLDIEAAEDGNEEQLSVAEINPLRYRGYYYDSETGMYYLQSRYYNPEFCRFISADDFSCLDTSSKLNANAYIYCWNCPVAFHDVQGTTPKLSINLTDIISFIQNINNRIKDGITEGINKLTEKWNKLTNNFKNTLKIRYNTFIDKLEYFINYPDAVINDTLSKIFNKDVNIRFRLIEYIREKTNFKIDLSNLKTNVENSDVSNIASRKISFDFADNEKTDNWFLAVLKGLTLAFQLDAITGIFEGIVQTFKPSFDFNKWFDDLSEINQDIFSGISLGITMLFNKIFSSAKDLLDFNKLSDILKDKAYSEIGEFIFESFTSLGGNFFSLWETFADSFNGYMDGTYRGYQGLAVFLLNASIMAISIYFPATSSTNILITTIITNAILNFEIDFENGHFWG